MNERLKIPWTIIFLTSLELEGFDDDLLSHILYTLYITDPAVLDEKILVINK